MTVLFAYRYNAKLGKARNYEIHRSIATGLGLGLLVCTGYCMFAITFWYGAKLVREVDGFTPGTWIVVSYLKCPFPLVCRNH